MALFTNIQSTAFHTSASRYGATPFGMPAMSPTMEEGGVVEWKVKEGDSFSSGDVLLEIETDKATIDVEAVDDGKLAKILIHDGAKEIKVGTTIAFTAEPEDDLATLTYPEEESAKPAPAAAATPPPAKKEEPKPAKSTEAPASSGPASSTSSGVLSKANPSQKFFPSVELLLEKNSISHDEALQKIQASGPNGRILKGDVLAYLGEIPTEAVTSIASFINGRTHLDLSNIKLKEAAPEAKSESPKADAAAPAAKAKPEPVKVSKSYTLPEDITIKSVADLLESAKASAERYAYATKTYAKSDLVDPIFEDLVAPSRNIDRFKISIKTVASEPDLFETPEETSLPSVVVELTLNEKASDSKKRAELFLSKFGEILSKA
ncbi:unnamed protein product [Kuraishia capsulata CBS 1993]|uniref:Dihydrolipoamide dehydrogenase-binding protein of pyruvate dehydrogenase complex n=1 Tax=Kuraishia capsulata CBS 1993 TaxID=1382522 RepID=W6MW09_9ASCO|nr:uncharacterized protein KUCA_T00002719001 [Kuraishia capsulata CBS 1993]CDK26745.1 unnamed protein product [Kuraishia capsulata CBS 1993]